MTDRETIARDKAAHQRLALNSRNGTAIPGLFFYRQPGGCVEASVQDEHDVDIIHFCEDAEARTFLREFEQFIADTAEPFEVVDPPLDHRPRVATPDGKGGWLPRSQWPLVTP